MPKLDLKGRTFGHLTVIKDDGTRSSRAIAWLCRCDCGKLTHVRTQALKSGAITSCGHVQRAKLPELQEKRRESSPEGTRLDQLGDTLSRNSATGYRNISATHRYGRLQYRVSVVYQRHQHGGLCDTLEEAIDLREQLRRQWWPGYSEK